jgi:hypothetical protein
MALVRGGGYSWGQIAKILRMAVSGIVFSVVASMLASGDLAFLLFATDTKDSPTFVAMIFLLGMVALLAGTYQRKELRASIRRLPYVTTSKWWTQFPTAFTTRLAVEVLLCNHFVHHLDLPA